MRNLVQLLKAYTTETSHKLLEVGRRSNYKDGKPDGTFFTSYKVLINFHPIDIRVNDDGKIVEEADTILAYVQAGNPLSISFDDDCTITIFSKNQYELGVRGTASKASIISPKNQK